jgi:hypothetical protein
MYQLKIEKVRNCATIGEGVVQSLPACPPYINSDREWAIHNARTASVHYANDYVVYIQEVESGNLVGSCEYREVMITR